MSGTMLSEDALRRELKTDRIFAHSSGIDANINGAGYELRLAGDGQVAPGPSSTEKYIKILAGEPPRPDFTLLPGQSALVSTMERFSLDFDVTAIIGPKFRWAVRGLLLLHGMVAHPGYGREQDESGAWVPKADERLYLVLANVGPEPITLRPGDKIAYVQFFEVHPAKSPRAVDNPGFDRWVKTVESGGGVAYFRMVEDLKEEIDTRQHDVETSLETLKAEVSRVATSADTVVVFGVFLVAATLMGVALDALVRVVGDLPTNLSSTRAILAYALIAVYIVVSLAGLLAVVRNEKGVLARWRDRRRAASGGG